MYPKQGSCNVYCHEIHTYIHTRSLLLKLISFVGSSYVCDCFSRQNLLGQVTFCKCIWKTWLGQRASHALWSYTLKKLDRQLHNVHVRIFTHIVHIVLSSINKHLLYALEKVQKFALRTCYKRWSITYSQLLERSNLPAALSNDHLFSKLYVPSL